MKTNILTVKVVQETNGVVTATTYSLDTGLNKLATVSSAIECVTSGVKYDGTMIPTSFLYTIPSLVQRIY